MKKYSGSAKKPSEAVKIVPDGQTNRAGNPVL
jgi:hypothetical protein